MNDRYGHAAGDAVLRATAGALRAQVRRHDVLARYGGPGLVQHVLVNDALPRRLRDAYQAQGQFPVDLDWDELIALGAMPVRGAFLDEADTVRHHPGLLAAAIMTWWEAIVPDERRVLRAPVVAGRDA